MASEHILSEKPNPRGPSGVRACLVLRRRGDRIAGCKNATVELKSTILNCQHDLAPLSLYEGSKKCVRWSYKGTIPFQVYARTPGTIFTSLLGRLLCTKSSYNIDTIISPIVPTWSCCRDPMSFETNETSVCKVYVGVFEASWCSRGVRSRVGLFG